MVPIAPSSIGSTSDWDKNDLAAAGFGQGSVLTNTFQMAQVTSAIATLDLGLGFEAGIAVVILAIYLDRLTAAIGQGDAKHGLLRFLPRRQKQAAADEANAEAEETASDEPAEESAPALGGAPRPIHS